MFRKIVASAAAALVAVSLAAVGVTDSGPAHGSPIVRGDLTTLALTGTDDLGWILLAVILLQFGVCILAVRAVLNRRRVAQHRAG
ncbi:MAG: hypothetical protein ABIO06_11360 [Pseudolysinimonas sp.]